MSLYRFIASEYEIPELRNKDWDDRGSLEICFERQEERYEDVAHYTELPFVYSLSFGYAQERAEQLYEYLKKYCKKGHKLQIWTIWLANGTSAKTFKKGIAKELSCLKKIVMPLNDLTVKDLTGVLHFIDNERTPIPAMLQLY